MDQASQIREKIDIVSLISEYIPLKKLGRNFTTICPFHRENSPSFVVSPERQIWHCFGCGKGGDVYTFLMEYENLEFVEALRILAKKTGVELKTTASSSFSSKKEEIYSLNNLAAEFYHYVLTNHTAGKAALSYLEGRGLSANLIKTFKIGFAPQDGEGLSNYLVNKKKYKNYSLVEAGLALQRGARVFDFFRGRIIFPLIDHRGNAVGFSARSITDNPDGPKYINTRETLVYHKGSMFFGLNQAKDEIKKINSAIVVEGEFDVISLFKEGIKNVVALKGTALTENQALLLSRFAPKVSLCLDQDEAGYQALKRSIPVLEKRGLLISVIIPNAKDPDEAIKKSPSDFKKAIKKDVEVYDFLLSRLISENDITKASGKKILTDEFLPLVSGIQNEIVKEHYLKKLSEEINISYESLLRQISKKGEEEKPQDVQSAEKKEKKEVREEYLLSLIVQHQHPKEIFEKVEDVLGKYEFDVPSYQKIVDSLSSFFKKNGPSDMKIFAKTLPKELLGAFDKCFLKPIPKFDDLKTYDEEILRASKDLRVLHLKKELNDRDKKPEELEKIRSEISQFVSS